MNKWNPNSPVNKKQPPPPVIDPDTQSRSSIQLSLSTRKKLLAFGHKGETYDDILLRLMDHSRQLDREQKAYQELIDQIAGFCYCKNCSARFFVNENQADRPVCPECMTTLDVELVGGF